MHLASSPRRLAAGLLWLAASVLPLLPARAETDPVATARTALVAGEFSTAKSLLDPVLLADPANGQAAFLRALARVGLAVETRLPAFATKLGARSVAIDLGSDTFDVTFAQNLVHETTRPLLVSGSVYHTPASPGPAPSVTFVNHAATEQSLTFAADFAGLQNFTVSLEFSLDGDDIGHLSVDQQGAYPWLDYQVVSFDPQNRTLTLLVPPGSACTIDFLQAPPQVSFTLVNRLPSTLQVLNGKRVANAYPRLAAGANFAWLFTFAAQTDAETLAPVVADLAVPAADFSITLAASETGLSTDLVLTYVDTQLLLAELKTFQAFRRLLDSYNFSQPVAPVLFSENGPAVLMRNTALLAPKAASPALAAERAAARLLFLAALDHYDAASDAGAWTRDDPASGDYLFALGDTDPAIRADQKLRLETALEQLRAALTDSVPLAELSDELAADPALPDGAGLSLLPFFGAPAVNLRALVPAIGPGGIIRGSSSKLLASGLLPGAGTAWWEDYLLAHGLADLDTPARQTGPVIQIQPAVLTTVAEGADAELSLVAECYPAPSYQWFRRTAAGDTPVEGATTPTLLLPAATRDADGVYLCKVTNSRLVPPSLTPQVKTLASRPARLVVTYPPEIGAQPQSLSRYTGKTVSLSVAAVGVPALRYQWFKGGQALTPARATPGYVFTAAPARAGEYHVVVSNERGSVSSAPALVDVQTRPVFTTQPLGRTVAVGGSVTFTVAATGNPAPQIKWRKDGRDIPGATGESYTIDSVTLAHRGVYSAVAFATVQTGPAATALASTASAGARLTVIVAP